MPSFGWRAPRGVPPALSRARRAWVTGAAVVGCGAAAHANREALSQLRLNATAIDAAAGAAGEVAQIALLYPLDTVKVRCQASGLGSRAVMRELWSGSQGSLRALLSALYAGAGPAAALSVLVGSVHFVAFCATRRSLARLAARRSDSQQQVQQQQQQQQQLDEPLQHVIVSHGLTGSHFLPLEGEEPEQQAGSTPRGRGSSQQQRQQQSPGGGELWQQQQPQQQPQQPQQQVQQVQQVQQGQQGQQQRQVQQQQQVQELGEGSLAINCAAAVLTALLTALVEAPIELFRHNSQAGNLSAGRSFVSEMWRTLRSSGPRALYVGFLPYCFEAWPYDISELLVVGSAKDYRRLSGPAALAMAPAAWDLAVGGLAGAVAVLVSHPFDVVKTYMQTHSLRTGSGLAGSAASFWATGQALVARRGAAALLIGLAPRLAHQVPGAMVCWAVVEAVHRQLLARCGDAAVVASGSGGGGGH